jgi:hypothetical protein
MAVQRRCPTMDPVLKKLMEWVGEARHSIKNKIS